MLPLEGEGLNRLFCGLLVRQAVCLESVCLLRRENQVADAMRHLRKEKLVPVISLFQVYSFLASLRCYYLLLKLRLLAFHFLAESTDELPEYPENISMHAGAAI